MSSPVDVITAEARAAAPINASVLVAFMAVSMVICTAFTAARLLTRFSIHQQFWWDDHASFIGWVTTMALCVLLILMVRHGGGLNMWDVPDDEFRKYSELFIDLQMVARIAMLFAKLSVLLLYIRLFFPTGVDHTKFWWVIQVVIWLNVLYTASLILLVTLQCVPYGKPWGSTCIDQYALLVVSSIINIISDIIILVIPLGSVWRLQMSRTKKSAIWALFAFGALAPLASVARLAYQVPLANGPNKTIIYVIVVLLAITEQVVAIIVGCAPVASVFFIKKHRAQRQQQQERQKNRSIPQRFRPARESALDARRRRCPADPYPITGPSITASCEALHSPCKPSGRDLIGDEWELEPSCGRQTPNKPGTPPRS